MRYLRNIPARGFARGTGVLALALGVLLSPVPAAAGESAGLIFTDRGPWALGERELHWRLDHQGPDSPAFRQVRDGRVTLAEVTDPSDGQPLLEIRETGGEDSDADPRVLGRFPVSSGDPMVVFFLENTARDMAMLTGGSPFYIRNRMKEALANAGPATQDADGGVAVELRPFADDPNGDRMKGFETLRLRFVMGSDPARPIREFLAETDGPVAAISPEGMLPQPVAPAPYRHAMVLE